MTHEEIMSQSIEVLDLDVRTYNALKRAGINTLADIEKVEYDMLDSLTMPPNSHIKAIAAYRVYIGLQEQQEAPTEISAPAQTEASVPTDKYAEAVQLNAQIMTSARAAQQNLYDMAMGFKKMRDDKLYKELGYDNFGDYCEGETGMKRQSVYEYISIVDKLPTDFVRSTLQIGKQKLFLLSTIDEEHRTEIIENTDLESTTVKELREQIEQLKQSEAKTKSQLEAAEEQNAVLSSEKEQFHRASKANLEKLNEERNRSANLEQQIRELESRPVDVVVQSDSDAQRKFNETIRKLNLEFEIFRDDADKELADMRNQRNKALDRAEAAEAQLNATKAQNAPNTPNAPNAPKEESNVKPFLIKMTVDDLSEIIEALSGSPKLQNIMKKVQVLRI